MHYQILLGALLATTTTTVFASKPYVQSFSNPDCTGADGGDQVIIKGGDCVRFDSRFDTVKINYGEGTVFEKIYSVDVFADDKCKVSAGDAVVSPYIDGLPPQCLGQNDHGGKWGSVRRTPYHLF